MVPDFVLSAAQDYLAQAGLSISSTTPATIAAEVQAELDALGWAAVLNVLDALPAPPTDTSTATRRIIIANAEALHELVYGLGIARLANIAADRDWPVYDDGLAAMETVGDQIDSAQAVVQDDVSGAMRTVRARALEHIRDQLRESTRLRPLTIINALPAAVLAFRLYGDAERDQEIIDRNQVENPGEMSGQVWVLER